MEIVALFLDEKSACFPLVKTAGDSRQNVDNTRYFKRAIPADSIHLLSRNVTQPTLNLDSWGSGQLLQSYLSNKSARIKSSYTYILSGNPSKGKRVIAHESAKGLLRHCMLLLHDLAWYFY